MENRTHPGYIDLLTEENILQFSAQQIKSVRTPNFSEFLPFINTQSLSEEEGVHFKLFLSSLFDTTKDLWRPRMCRGVSLMIDDAKSALKRVGVLGDININQYNRAHFWMVLQMSSLESHLVVDPTGLPQDLSSSACADPSTFLPYFGLPENAAGYIRVIYEEGKPMDEWGTRDLPPSFHP